MDSQQRTKICDRKLYGVNVRVEKKIHPVCLSFSKRGLEPDHHRSVV